MATWEEQFSAYLSSHQLGTPLTYEQWLSNYRATNVGVHKHPIKIRYTYPPPAPGAPIAPEYSQAALYMDFTNNAGRLNGTWGPAVPLLACTRASVAQMDTLEGWWGQFAANAPRWSNKGLLVEATKTNGLRNNTFTGAVAGTPGTAPTNTFMAGSVDGLTQTIVAIGNELGVDYMDVRWAGTANTTRVSRLFYSDEGVNNAAALATVNGQTWTSSRFLKIVAGSLANVTFTFGVSEYSVTPTFLAQTTTAVVPTATLTRYSSTRTLNQATVAFVQGSLNLSYTSGNAIDITLRIGWPQLEQGGFASSPIRTLGAAAVTRASDTIDVTGLTPGSSQGTLFAEYMLPYDSLVSEHRGIAAVDDGTTNNRVYMWQTTSTDVPVIAAASGGSDTLIVTGLPTAMPYGAVKKVAGAFAVNDGSGAFNGTLGTPDVSGAFPVGLAAMRVGRDGSGLLDGYLRRLAYWPTRLTDAQLTYVTGGPPSPVGPTYSAEASAIFAAFTTPPTDPRKALIDACVVSLKSAGVWAKLDCMYMLAAADSQAAKINWKAPGTFTGTEVNAPIFTANRGFKCDTGLKYIDSGWIAGTNGVNYLRDSASVHVWNNTVLRVDGVSLIGFTDGACTVAINPWNTGADNAQIALNCTVVNALNVGGPSISMFSMSRTSGASYTLSRDGVSIGTQSTASVALGTTATMRVVTGQLPSLHEVGFGAWGGGLTPTEITALYNAVRAYMTGVGVP